MDHYQKGCTKTALVENQSILSYFRGFEKLVQCVKKQNKLCLGFCQCNKDLSTHYYTISLVFIRDFNNTDKLAWPVSC